MKDLESLVADTNDLNTLNTLKILINEKIEAVKKDELVLARQQIKEIAERLGVDAKTLITASSKKAKVLTEPTHQNPNNLKETWVGRGKHPKWLQDAISNGQNIDDFRIK